MESIADAFKKESEPLQEKVDTTLAGQAMLAL
jgi:hypothetical protein